LEDNVVVVSHADRYRAQARREFVAADVRWIAAPPTRPDLDLKLRHGPTLVPCTVAALGGARWAVTMAVPDPGVAPGQWAVFYEGEYCLGGGVIE
jgi:tRNA U34 2-thiouridine synthase MnmA/TrmU